MWHSICYVHYGYYIQRDQSALYTNFGTICTMATLERPKCTLHQFWHNVHYGYSRETKVQSTLTQPGLWDPTCKEICELNVCTDTHYMYTYWLPCEQVDCGIEGIR